MKETVDVIIRKVNKAEWKKFREICLKEDISATEKIKRMIAKEIQKAEKK